MENLTPNQEEIQKGRLSQEDAEKDAEYLKEQTEKASFLDREPGYKAANSLLEDDKVMESRHIDFVGAESKVQELINKLQSSNLTGKKPIEQLKEALTLLSNAHIQADEAQGRLHNAGIEIKK